MIVQFTCYGERGTREHPEKLVTVQMDGVPRIGESVWLATTDRIWDVFDVRWMPGEGHAAEVALR